LTSADDGRILAYNLKKRGNLAEGKVFIDKDSNGKKKKPKKNVRGGASSMSK
jgi:hypothetical protein